jgi:glutathione synthase/RimK-type ligase-like ATP-grasp enzyme
MLVGILTTKEMPDLMPYDQEVMVRLRQENVECEVVFWEDVLEQPPASLHKYQLMVFRTVWNYYKNADSFYRLLDILKASGVPTANPLDIIRWNMEKSYLKKLMDEGYDVIPTVFSNGDPQKAYDTAQKQNWDKMVLKPMISGGSYHTYVLEKGEEAKYQQYIQEHFVNRPFMLQEFIPGITEGEISTITFSNGYTYSVTKVPKAGDYRVQFNYGGQYRIHETPAEIQHIAEKIFDRQERRTLYQRLDGVWHNGKFLIMEVELLEPDLYLNLSEEALQAFTESVLQKLKETKPVTV